MIWNVTAPFCARGVDNGWLSLEATEQQQFVQPKAKGAFPLPSTRRPTTAPLWHEPLPSDRRLLDASARVFASKALV